MSNLQALPEQVIEEFLSTEEFLSAQFRWAYMKLIEQKNYAEYWCIYIKAEALYKDFLETNKLMFRSLDPIAALGEKMEETMHLAMKVPK